MSRGRDKSPLRTIGQLVWTESNRSPRKSKQSPKANGLGTSPNESSQSQHSTGHSMWTESNQSQHSMSQSIWTESQRVLPGPIIGRSIWKVSKECSKDLNEPAGSVRISPSMWSINKFGPSPTGVQANSIGAQTTSIPLLDQIC